MVLGQTVMQLTEVQFSQQCFQEKKQKIQIIHFLEKK